MVAALRRARLIVGLSWPNLTGALGRSTSRATSRPTDPRRWGVLYLGSALPLPQPPVPARPSEPLSERPSAGEIIALGRDGRPLSDQHKVLRSLEGIVLLDGTWSQAKTLWWRNPWLLRLQRLVLNPPDPARLAGCAASRGPRRSRRSKPLPWCCAMSSPGRTSRMRCSACSTG